MADIAKIVEELSAWSVMDIANLVKELEAKWGVTAAAPVAAAAAPAGAAAPVVEAKTMFDVILVSVPAPGTFRVPGGDPFGIPSQSEGTGGGADSSRQREIPH